MSDDTILPGTGETYSADDRGGVKFQKTLINTFDGISCDAFARFRTSDTNTLFDSKLLNADNQALLWDEELESGTMATAGPTAAKPFIDFTSTDVTAGQRTRQTFERFNYQPGKSQMIAVGGVLELASGVTTGCERRIGIFDNDNGIFFESDAGTIGVTVRTNDTGSPADTTVAQASWNLDTLDGGADAANPSGVTFDATKCQIFFFDYQAIFGRIRFGLEVGGVPVYVHEHNVSNLNALPWASTPNLPVRFQIITTSSSGVCSMRVGSCAVISEGGVDERGTIRYRSTEGAALVTDTENTLFVVVALRLKTTHLGAHIIPIRAQLQIQTASEKLEWVLIHGCKGVPITVGASLTYADLTNSVVQTALGDTTHTATGGTIIDGGYLETGLVNAGAGSSAAAVRSTLTLGAAIDGTRSEVMLAVRPIGGVSAMDVEGSITWQEIT